MIAELASILALAVVAILWKYHQWRTSHLFRIPGPKCNFTFKEWVVGVFRIIQDEPFMQPQQRWWKESGPDTQMMHVTGVFGRHFIFVLDADGVKQVLSSKAGGKLPRFIKGLEFLKKVIGEGLVTIDGDEWQRHRKIMQPIFDNQVLKEALNSCLPDIMDRFVAAWKEKAGGELDLTSHCAALALDIIGKVAFSHDFQAVTSVEQWAKGAVRQVELNDPLIKSLYTSMMPSMLRMLFVNLRLGALERFYLRESFNAQVILDREFATVVDRSYARYIRRDKASTESKCLLDYLFDAQTTSRAGSTSNSLTHKELQGEMKTLIFAGHETTATLCVWAIFSIIKHKEVEHLVVDDILKHSPKNVRMTFESVEKMDYLDAFLKEVLRMHPPVGQIARTTTEWTNILGENIPPNTRIAIPIYLLHRHPQYWSEPESFKPERWLDIDQTSRKFRPFSYLPFSAGPRACIGQRFAMWEAKFILASIFREFEMKFSPSFDEANIRLVSFISTKCIPAIKICAQPRSVTASEVERAQQI